MPKPKPTAPAWKQQQKDARKQKRAEERSQREQEAAGKAERVKLPDQQTHSWPPARLAAKDARSYRCPFA